MAQELKVRLQDPQVVEQRLHQLKARFLGEADFIDTYFVQPVGKVLKLSQKDSGSSVIRLEADADRFRFIDNQPVGNPEAIKQQLSEEYSVKKVLSGHRKFYQLDDHKITLNSIVAVGEFLIVTSDHPQKRFVEGTLGITQPKYITVSFDELPSLL